MSHSRDVRIDSRASPTAQRLSPLGGTTVATLGTVQVPGYCVTPAQRSLLAALVLTRRTGATNDVLTASLWPRDAPPSARASVQNQIGRLRRTVGADAIVSRDGRYFLTTATDVDHFEDVAAATARPVGTLEPATIEGALSLWRGTPYDELADDHEAQVARVRLESMRTRLIERLAVERLSRGKYDDAAASLRVHVAAEPFHERAWELLIAARYLAGRRTEALAEYIVLEELLADRLDIHPSAALRRLRVTVATERPLYVNELIAPNPTAAIQRLDGRRPA